MTPILEQFYYEIYRVLVMPYECGKASFGVQNLSNLSIRFISIVMYRIAIALSTLHNNNILLRNTKLANMIVDGIESEEPKPQIFDFENSIKLVDSDPILYSSDILSYGLTFLFLIHDNVEKMFEQYPDLKDLIQRTLEADPQKRISAFEIIEHPFFESVLGDEWIRNENESLYAKTKSLLFVEEEEEYDDFIGI
ncbi:AGC family protein kinase [Histomonas meleagridis]|uniref:AGC family protein kinase n=1 Tax=Histomonas meleagridis TaxID=135588 RepID=UPI00355A8C74|nr:AGC family protein kinase [Histomonas meleagridis]KAH0801942.1 AGC family protein kinase [Histomonas meleagridis]